LHQPAGSNRSRLGGGLGNLNDSQTTRLEMARLETTWATEPKYTRMQRGLMLLDFMEIKILFTTVKDNLVQYCLLCMAV
jgi:hypothetical protein